MDIDQLLSFIGAILGGGIIGAIISALATIFYGERRVEKLRIRREHSTKINDEVLKKWLENVEEYTKLGAEYSRDTDGMVGIEPKDPMDLDFFDVTQTHLEQKYPGVLKAWEELKHATSEHNKRCANFLEEIRTSIIEEVKMAPYYWKLHGRAPEEHVAVDRFVQSVYQEMEFRSRKNYEWASGKPQIVPTMTGEKRFFELGWGSYRLVRSLDEDAVRSAIALIDRIAETPSLMEAMKNQIKNIDTIYRAKRENFEVKLRDVVKSIELGNILEGKCRFCP